MRAVLGLDREGVAQRGVEVDGGRERAAHPRLDSGPGDEQRDVAHLGVNGHRRLAPRASLAQVVAVVGAEHDRGGVPGIMTLDDIEDATEPVVDHRQLGSVLRPHVPCLALGEPGAGCITRVRRPDEALALPLGVVARRPGLGHVEGLVRIELVDHEQRSLMRFARRRELAVEPLGCRDHRARAGEVGLFAEPGAGRVVAAGPGPRLGGQRRCADPGRVGPHAPRVVLVAAQVVPGAEVDVVVLAAGLEQVRMVRHEHGGDPRVASQQVGDGVLPDLDRSPWPPGEVERADEQVVAGRHARQRARVVVGEPHRAAASRSRLGVSNSSLP